ncbi:MAG: UDP-N-acetylmuramoyl-tripeptide--D-alanyl-D-alanine ligase [Chloroflexota bacterium]|nr:UDP-N-acetylmuramoyl-tripeptide--D-alanyl-D-alanine ligase [Chloroflexota bacterium]
MCPGGLFVAIATARRDGHDFVADAFQNGARAALVARVPSALQHEVEHGLTGALDFRAGAGGAAVGRPMAPQSAPSGTRDAIATARLLLLVDDPLRALQGCATWWRRRHRARVLAVAGAVGKTTTKELLANILQQRYRTLRTPGNFNNELGLPITLLQLTPEHEVVALEIGISEVGEMATFGAIAGAEVAVMTRIVPEHMEQLGDLDSVEREEGRLIEALPAHGVAVLNRDDPRVARMAQRTAARVVWFGESAGAGVRATGIEARGLEGLSFDIQIADLAPRRVHLPLVGRHFVTAALAAAAAALAVGCTWEDVLSGLSQAPAAQRLAARRLPGGVTLLDDAYNASPDSTKAALDVLGSLAGRRIALLGDMLELGAYASPAHREVGEHVPGRADVLVTVGAMGREIARAARTAGAPAAGVHECDSTAEAISLLPGILRRGDTLLVKGSHSMHLEVVVQALSHADG